MGQLLVRGLDDRIIGSLKRRAERNGRSVESEHRAILKSALAPETESFLCRARGPAAGGDTAEHAEQHRSDPGGPGSELRL